MAKSHDSVFGDVVSVLVAVKTADGRILWIGGDSKDATVSFCRDPRYGMADWLRAMDNDPTPRFKPYVEFRATIENYTGQWREGVPDVQRELEAGAKALPSGPPETSYVRPFHE